MPLRELLRKDSAFNWTSKHDKCIDEIRERLNSATPQTLPDELSNKFVDIHVNEQTVEVKVTSEDGHLIGRSSQILSPTESRYTLVEKALLAMIMAYRNFGHCLKSNNVTFRSGIKCLKRAVGLIDMPQRIQRLILRLPPEAEPRIVYDQGLDYSSNSAQNNDVDQDEKVKAMSPDKDTEAQYDAVYYTDGACQGNGKPEGKA